MTEMHKVRCDRCGKIEDMTYNYEYYLPSSWKNIEKNWFIKKYLCGKCVKQFKKHTKEFWI